MKLVVALVCTLLLVACATDIPVDPPEPAGPYPQWQYVESKSYEPASPGLGTSQRFRAESGWIDVYTYTLRRSAWAPGVGDPAFAAHFANTIEEVRALDRQGTYTDLRVGEERDVTIEGRVFRAIGYRLTLDGKPVESLTYLSAIDGRLVKYRISLWAPVTPAAGWIARRFIKEDLPRRTRGSQNL